MMHPHDTKSSVTIAANMIGFLFSQKWAVRSFAAIATRQTVRARGLLKQRFLVWRV